LGSFLLPLKNLYYQTQWKHAQHLPFEGKAYSTENLHLHAKRISTNQSFSIKVQLSFTLMKILFQTIRINTEQGQNRRLSTFASGLPTSSRVPSSSGPRENSASVIVKKNDTLRKKGNVFL